MAERLTEWPLPPPAAWEVGALSTGPDAPPGDLRCLDCDGLKDPKAQRCKRCSLSKTAERRERIRMLLAPPQNRSAREVAEILGVNVATVYRARARW